MKNSHRNIGRSPFPLGEIRIAASAKRRVSRGDMDAGLQRHARCDWGELTPEEWATNDANLSAGHRLLSTYRAASGCTFWVITDYDLRSTTVF